MRMNVSWCPCFFLLLIYGVPITFISAVSFSCAFRFRFVIYIRVKVAIVLWRRRGVLSLLLLTDDEG
jgi:hypothetical protein